MRRVALTAGLLALVFAGCGGDGGGDAPADTPNAPAAKAASVEIKTFMFTPDPITVKAGETVTWTNADSAVHTVTAGTRKKPDPKAFDSELAEKTGQFEQTFDKPGTYDYFCALHSGPGMTGQIVVE